jgi:hypothetical protein
MEIKFFFHLTILFGKRKTSILEEFWLLAQDLCKLDKLENLIIQVAKLSMY